MAYWDPFFDVEDGRPPTPLGPSGLNKGICNSGFLEPSSDWVIAVKPSASALNPPNPFPKSVLTTGPVPTAGTVSFATRQFLVPCVIGLGPLISARFLESATPYMMTKMEDFEAGHLDRVTVLHINFDGSRILTASVDHRIKVWERDGETGERKLIDTFAAHGADIRDAKWLHIMTGTQLASIGNDLRFRLWAEDESMPPNSGRRFKLVSEMHSSSKVPFVSLDFKTIAYVYTYLALIDRQGLLSVYEPSSPDDFKEWSLIDQFNVCQPALPPDRGEETSFKVRFDPNPCPLAYSHSYDTEKTRLSLVVSAMNEVKIYRSVRNTSANPAKPFEFWEAARLPVHPALIRDVQWAPFNARGTDYFATACRDGGVRIYEMKYSHRPAKDASGENTPINDPFRSSQHQSSTRPAPPQQSILTSAIASRTGSLNPSNPTSSLRLSERAKKIFPFQQEVTPLAELLNVHRDAWAVAWDPNGQVLMSNGADGVTKMWKRSVLNDQWLLFSDQEIQIDDDDDEGDDDGDSDKENKPAA